MKTDLKKVAIYTAAGLGAGLFVGLATTQIRRRKNPYQPVPRESPGPWVDPDAPRRIREIATPLAKKLNMPGLPEFLIATAWIESRGNPYAGSDAGNDARGWFGMRPKSARVSDIGLSPDALKDEELAVALAAWYIERLRPYAASGQEIDWIALRRGWAYPHLVDDVNNPGYKAQFDKGLAAASQPTSFMNKRAFLKDYSWPGIEQVLDTVQS